MLEAVGILSLSNYSWTVGFQTVSLGTHGLHYMFVSLGTHGLHYLFPFVGNFLLEAVGILSLSSYSWTLELDCFVRHAWFALPVFSRDGIFLRETVGILRLIFDNWIADCLDWKVTNLIESMIHKRVVFSCVAVNKYF